MSKTWHPDRWDLKLREKQGKDDWKRDLRRAHEEEEEVSEVKNVYVIINEWTDIANNTSSEVVGAKWFAIEDDAWVALNIIAESYGTDLDDDETSLEFEDHKPGLQSEEYYIQELTKG